jgi:hypothetical protein
MFFPTGCFGDVVYRFLKDELDEEVEVGVRARVLRRSYRGLFVIYRVKWNSNFRNENS